MNMKKLYIYTEESSSGGEAESDEQWGHHSDVVREVTFLGVSRESSGGFFPTESFEVDDVFNADRGSSS